MKLTTLLLINGLPNNKVVSTKTVRFATTTKPTLTDTSNARLTTIIAVNIRHEEVKIPLKNVLVDTGCSRTIIRQRVLPTDILKSKVDNEIVWATKGGNFVTKIECPITFDLPEFTSSREFTWTCAIDASSTNDQQKYDMIIGRDLQQHLKLDIVWSTSTLHWDGLTIPMRPGRHGSDVIFLLMSRSKFLLFKSYIYTSP